MRALNLITIAFKYVVRNRTRSILTVFGVATGMFLFGTIETMQDSLKNATEITANDTTLVVYRENRYCPSTSRPLSITRMRSKRLRELKALFRPNCSE